jgi:hypothetical protein
LPEKGATESRKEGVAFININSHVVILVSRLVDAQTALLVATRQGALRGVAG